MAVVGFNFNKICIERKKGQKAEKVGVNNNVQITDVSVTELSFGKSNQQCLTLSFEFTSKYEPPIGDIVMTGDVLQLLEDSKQAEEIAKQWKKSKTLPDSLSSDTISTVLVRCNVEALLLTRDVNLPPPMPMVLPNIGRQQAKPQPKK